MRDQDIREILANLLRALEKGEFRDHTGHPVANNIHFLKAKAALTTS